MEATTEISAINGMLATIGEAPINTLEDTGLVDVTIAKGALDEVVRAVIVEGWAFNTDVAFPFGPEAFAPYAINIPSNAFSVLPSRDFAHLIVRGTRMYDRTRMSFDFQGFPPVPCEVIWAMDFDELPEVTRQFVAVTAGRLFQTRTTASALLHQITQSDENKARMAHRRSNVKVNRRNFLIDSNSVFSIHANR